MMALEANKEIELLLKKTCFLQMLESKMQIRLIIKSGVGIKMIKMDIFQYFFIKSYVVDVY